MTILVVDDSSVMRKIVARSIRQAGYGHHDVEQAEDGQDALEKIRESCPDIVLCDWNMPRMNGIELVKALREEGIQVPFGFVTSESTAEQRSQGLGAGAAFLLSKPFTADDLAEQLDKFL
ncbi:MAG: response regulator [Acidimicrobiales bacterium]